MYINLDSQKSMWGILKTIVFAQYCFNIYILFSIISNSSSYLLVNFLCYIFILI